jgi:gamma-glutamylcysteine synthetase
MRPFFSTREYKSYKLCLAAVRAMPTYNNLSKYWKYMSELIEMAETDYDKIGINQRQEYMWIEDLKIPDYLYQRYKYDGKTGGFKR